MGSWHERLPGAETPRAPPVRGAARCGTERHRGPRRGLRRLPGDAEPPGRRRSGPSPPHLQSALSESVLAEAAAEAETFLDQLRQRVVTPGPDGRPRPVSGPAETDERPEVAGYEILGEARPRGRRGRLPRPPPALNRLVALKMILAGPHLSPEARQRFRRRGPGHRPAAAPEHRAGLRRRRARGLPLPLPRAGRGREPGGSARRRAAAVRRGGADRRDAGEGRRLRPSARA